MVQNLDPATTPVVLAKQYLRVIGNCVADNGMRFIARSVLALLNPRLDANRELITEDFEKLLACLQETELTTTALAVLFNLCNDFGMLRRGKPYGLVADRCRTCSNRSSKVETG